MQPWFWQREGGLWGGAGFLCPPRRKSPLSHPDACAEPLKRDMSFPRTSAESRQAEGLGGRDSSPSLPALSTPGLSCRVDGQREM